MTTLLFVRDQQLGHQEHSELILFFWGGGFPGYGKLAKPAHQKALEKSLGMALEKSLGMAIEKSLGITDQSCPMLRLSHKK